MVNQKPPLNLAQGLYDELERTLDLLLTYAKLNQEPNVYCDFAIAAIRQTIRQTGQALLEGDIVAMIRCYEQLKEHE